MSIGWKPIDTGPKPRPQGFMRYTSDEPPRADVDLDAPDMLAAEYLRQGSAARNRLLNAELDDRGRRRLEGQLVIWHLLWERVTIAAHWASGEGDRKLF